MISRTETEKRLSKVAPMIDELTQPLASLQQAKLPFHPVILVFATGQVSEQDCLPMRRVPMPKVGAPFDSRVVHALAEAFATNPSIHDGAIIFERSAESNPYFLSAWSMRIVSKEVPSYSEPNFGSAYNSALSLSISRNIDACCIVAPRRTTIFRNGVSHLSEG